MKREDLNNLELSDEQVDEVMKLHGETINNLKESNEGVTEELKSYKEQLAERDKQLNDLSEKHKDDSNLQEQLQLLKDQNEQLKNDYEDKLYKQNFNHVLDKTLSQTDAKNIDVLKALLNYENIQLEDGKLNGLDEQLTALKESDSYLFDSKEEDSKPQKRTVAPGDPVNENDNSISTLFSDVFNN